MPAGLIRRCDQCLRPDCAALANKPSAGAPGLAAENPGGQTIRPRRRRNPTQPLGWGCGLSTRKGDACIAPACERKVLRQSGIAAIAVRASVRPGSLLARRSVDASHSISAASSLQFPRPSHRLSSQSSSWSFSTGTSPSSSSSLCNDTSHSSSLPASSSLQRC